MARQIFFEPKPYDPKLELQKRLEAAPAQHADALLKAYDVLQSAHDTGLLDILHGALGARDTIVSEAARFAATDLSTNAIRNLLNLGKILGELPPDLLANLARAVPDAVAAQRAERTPPGILAIFRQALSKEGRRGLSFAAHLLTGLGKASIGQDD
jgi:uncharacterized protein YjgD (DUF1641 family)